MYLRNTWYNQTVREIQVTIYGTIVLRVLDSPDTLLTILVLLLRTEVIEQVGLQAITGIEGGIGIFHHLLQVGIANAGNLVAVSIILMVCLIEIYLSKESSACSFGGAAFFYLCDRKHSIGILQIVDDLLPAFVVGIFCVREVVVILFCHVRFVHERNLLEQALQLEVTIGTQELHLSCTLYDGIIVLICTCQDIERQVDTTQIVIETCPDRAEWPVGGHHTNTLFQTVERFTIREVRTAYISIVRAGIVVPE